MCEGALKLRHAPALGEYVYRVDKVSNLIQIIDSGCFKATGPAPSIQNVQFVLDYKKNNQDALDNVLKNRAPSYNDIPAEPALAAIDGWDIPCEDLLHGPWVFFFINEEKAFSKLNSETRVIRVSVQSLKSLDWYSDYYVDGAMCSKGAVIYFPCKEKHIKSDIIPIQHIELFDNEWVSLASWKK